MFWVLAAAIVILTAFAIYAVNSAGRVNELDEAGGGAIKTFEKCNAYPQVRCPLDDIIVDWAAQGSPVTLTFNGKNQSLDPSGSYRIPAAEAELAPQHTTLVMKIEPNGESRSFDIDSIRGETKFDRTATATAKPFEFQNEFPKPIWSDHILFLAVEFLDPLTIPGLGKGPVAAGWQYDAGMTNGTLDRSNNFAETFSPPVLIDSARTWVFSLINVPKKQSEQFAVKENLGSTVKFRVVVKCSA